MVCAHIVLVVNEHIFQDKPHETKYLKMVSLICESPHGTRRQLNSVLKKYIHTYTHYTLFSEAKYNSIFAAISPS